MRTQQIWQHMTSGERFAVELDDGGKVVSVNGPLHYSEVSVRAAEALHYDCTPEDADWMQEHEAEYRLVESDETDGGTRDTNA